MSAGVKWENFLVAQGTKPIQRSVSMHQSLSISSIFLNFPSLLVARVSSK